MKKNLIFMAGALALSATASAAFAQDNSIRVPGSNGPRTSFGNNDPRGTGRDDDQVYALGRDYANRNYDRLIREYPDSSPFAVNSLQNRIVNRFHPQRLVGGGVGRVLGD